jgi:glutathionylspermidine amidase/synthetase
VWKTWSWSTAINQLKENEFEEWLTTSDGETMSKRDVTKKPLLVDVLLHPHIRVFEPLWTMIPASKAILPVLCKLYPNHPYLLETTFDKPTEKMVADGYVAKPITGRGGGNVILYDRAGAVMQRKAGKWQDDTYVYQELCLLPEYGDERVQVCCFTTRNRYMATVLRVDKSLIIDMDSSVFCLRIIP